MLEILPESRDNLLVLHASDHLTTPDYEQLFIPALEAVLEHHDRARLLLYMDEDFRGWEPGALWEDARFGVRHRDDFERIAVVGGPDWLDWGANLANLILEGEVRSFDQDSLAAALAWVSGFPAAPEEDEGLFFELDEAARILTVRPQGPLRKEYFLEVRRRVDPFIERHGPLRGVLIVAERFPWWEDLAGMIAHLEFVHDHHRKVEKLALVSRDNVVRLFSGFARHFVQAEVRRFDDETQARDWIRSGG